MSEDGAGLTPDETKEIGKTGGSCYEEGLIKLGKCLVEQNQKAGSGDEEPEIEIEIEGPEGEDEDEEPEDEIIEIEGDRAFDP